LSSTIPSPTTNPAESGNAAPVFETVPFTALDGIKLNFKHLPPVPGRPNEGPVIMVAGAGVRADLFCKPTGPTLPQMFVG